MTTAVLHKTVNRAAAYRPASAVVPVHRSVPAQVQLQSSLKVSKPDDPAEKEADQTAKRVMRLDRVEPPHLARFQGAISLLSRKTEGQPNVAPNVEAEIQNSVSSGTPLPLTVRQFMEPRFGANFDAVRVHTGEKAAKLNKSLSAQAFTIGNNIFFGKDQFQPETHEGKALIAHELTHTIQQGSAVQRSEVSENSPVQVQRLGMSDALDYFADKANIIPGFRMLTVILGVNPINMQSVDRSAANILRAMVEFMPGGGLITQALDGYGIFDKAGAWIEQQVRSLGMTGSAIKQAVTDFLDTLSWKDILDLGGVWERAKRIFTGPVDRLIEFAKQTALGILGFIRDAILRPLAGLVAGTRGYDLLKAVLGQDPITGDPVPQNAETLIGGFMKLIGQEEIWENLKKSNAVARAWAWFQGALAAVKAFVQQIPALFITALKSLDIFDLVLPPRAFIKIATVFGSFVLSFMTWAGNAIWNLLEIIFDVVSPGAFGYVKKTGAALKSILKNPLPFVGNLVKAAKQGFLSFGDNFLTHLKAGLFDWLTGSLPGVYIPRSFDLKEIAKFALSVLGLTWENIRGKLVKVIGETAVKVLETTFDIVVTLVKDGPAAAWEQIKTQLSNLKDMVIDGIIDFVIDLVVKKAIPKLIAMFIPGAGFISAILSIYDTIMVFVNKISKIIQVVTGFINSITAIAAGQIGAAAAKVESTLAGLLALAINFLAGFIGLGKVADKIMGVINKVRAPIDKAIDWLINWIVTMAKKLGKMAAGAVKGLLNWSSIKSTFADDEGQGHTIQISDAAPHTLVIATSPIAADKFLRWYVGKKGAAFETDNKALIGEIRGLIGQAQTIIGQIEATEKAKADDPKLEALQRDLLNKNVEISGKIKSLVGSDRSIGKAKEKYTLEGITGTYRSMPKPPGDDFTADHQPQAAILQAAAEFDYFSDTGELARRAAGRAQEGYAINLHKIRHMAGRTFGSKGKQTKEGFLAEITKATKGKKAEEKRAIVVEKIRADMMSDVKAMQSVANAASTSPNWADIKDLSAKKDEKEKLVGEIRGRILAGESQIAAQNVDALAGPAIPPPAPAPPPKAKRAAISDAPVTASPQMASQIQSSTSSPLPGPVRTFMEPRFGADFGNVRTHTGPVAARLADQMNAHAFTVGSNIFFGSNQFQPGTESGKELIAHELTHTIQDGERVNRKVVKFAGKRLFVTSEGRLIDLPDDMTDEDATRLESEGKAAQTKLGKRPPPRPVPDAKKLAKKEEKEKFKPEAKKKALAKAAPSPKAAAAAAALMEAVGKGKVAQYLAAKGAPILARGVGMLQRLKANEQTHDNAGEKRQQSENAVVIPTSDNQSKSNAGQVNMVGGRQAPVVDENKGKGTLQSSLAENVPRTMEDADNFKRDKKAQVMGADVAVVVQGDKNAVTGTFSDIEHTPPASPPEHEPVTLPPTEVAPPTPVMNLGAGTIAPLQKEHTDVSNFTKEADSKLNEEGVTQEQLDMVDSGELAEANKEKKGMEKTAKSEPEAIQKFSHEQREGIDQDLKQEEKKQRAEMTAKRGAGLTATGQRQKAAKSALEKKRDEVATKINDMYKTAQGNVKRKLDDLETRSIKRFDDGNAKASREFEENVNREIDAFKEDRYSGWFGWARKAKDWIRGIDDLPAVKAIFERNRKSFVDTINKLVDNITAENKAVIKECKDELAKAQKQIKEYVDGLGPALKGIGQQAAEEMKSKLADLDRTIDRRGEELQNKLKDRQTAAIRAIDEKIEKMKEAMSGALAKLGRLLLWAAKKFFKWALEKFGVSLSTIDSIIDKGVAVLKAIFTHPIQFVKNLVNAATTGFKNFAKNFLTHLKDAVFEWLTGSLEGVTLPSSWDLMGILGVVFQLIRLTYANIRAHLVRLVPEPVVRTLETGFELVQTLITKGPMAAWDQLKSIGETIKDAFIGAVTSWIKWELVEKAVTTIASMLIPGAGIIRAIIGIYDTIVFFIQKAKQIIDMIGNFLGSISEIAAGNIGGAAQALENGLARALKLVIDFLARFLHLSGITSKIRSAIDKVGSKVDDVIEKVANWIVGMARKAGKMAVSAVKGALNWASAKITFKDDEGEGHTIQVSASAPYKLMIASSNPLAAGEFVEWYVGKRGKDFRDQNKDILKDLKTLVTKAQTMVDSIEEAEKKNKPQKTIDGLLRDLLEHNRLIGEKISKLVKRDPSIGKEVENRYKLEGLTGTYASMPKPPRDEFTADHQPQAAILELAAEQPYFTANGNMVKRAAKRAAEGRAINLHYIRHMAGRTYGSKGADTKAKFETHIEGATKDKSDTPKGREDSRKIVVKRIKDDLGEDVKEMRKVIKSKSDSKYWTDIKDKLTGKKGEDLIKEVRDRISKGEDQMEAQDLDSLVD
jgi:hypothetical protein